MEVVWPDWLTETMISNALGRSKIIKNISISPAASKGDHFLSTILRAEIKYQTNSGKTTQKTSIIIKSFPEGFLKSFIYDNDILKKEFLMYTEVLPMMCDILGKYIVPKCLESCNTDVLMLEDLKLENFESGNRINGLNLDQCISAIKTLAEFHGASYLMNNTHSEIMDCVKKEVQFTNENKFEKNYITNTFKILAEEVKNWPDCEKYSSKLFNIREKIWNKTIEEILPKENEITVLNHGDFWTNNILFRYDEKNQIVKVKLIDFQFSRWSSPASDLQTFFIMSVRNNEYKQAIINAYLTRLNELIHPQCITKTQLLNSLHRSECIGMVIAVCILPLVLLDPNKITNIEATDPDNTIDEVNDNAVYRVACKDDVFKQVFPSLLKHYEDIGLF